MISFKSNPKIKHTTSCIYNESLEILEQKGSSINQKVEKDEKRGN
jgi:hypothetical protein